MFCANNGTTRNQTVRRKSAAAIAELLKRPIVLRLLNDGGRVFFDGIAIHTERIVCRRSHVHVWHTRPAESVILIE